MRTAMLPLLLSLCAGGAFGEASVTIGGTAIQASGSQVTVRSGTVVVDGQVFSGNLVQGSGRLATENRELGEFDELYLHISADVTVTAGEKGQCEITADDNILPLILTERSGNRLRISARDSYSSTQKTMLALRTPLLTKVEMNGSGDVAITDVTRDRLILVIRGSGDITATGKVTELRAAINGSGDVRAAALEAKAADIRVSGSGDADVHVAEQLTAEVHGSGRITYSGSPSRVHASVTGSGDIVRAAAGGR